MEEPDVEWMKEVLVALLSAYSSLVGTLTLTAMKFGAPRDEIHAALLQLLESIAAGAPSERTRKLLHDQLEFYVKTFDPTAGP